MQNAEFDIDDPSIPIDTSGCGELSISVHKETTVRLIGSDGDGQPDLIVWRGFNGWHVRQADGSLLDLEPPLYPSKSDPK